MNCWLLLYEVEAAALVNFIFIADYARILTQNMLKEEYEIAVMIICFLICTYVYNVYYVIINIC